MKEAGIYQNAIRGCLFGGAAGDALGYPVEFMKENDIFSEYGSRGIQEYALDPKSGKALISDDTQMTLFTANGILTGETRLKLRGVGGMPHVYLPSSYQDWLYTQEMTFEESRKQPQEAVKWTTSWLLDVPELYAWRAPGNTCLDILHLQRYEKSQPDSFIRQPQSNSKGCGGIMRVAPMGLRKMRDIRRLDWEGAEIAAITHGHSLGYMPAAVLVHIIQRIVYPEKTQTLKEIVFEARDTVAEIFAGDEHLEKLIQIINLSVELSENKEKDIVNIHRLGEGWVAEETLAIAVYCALKYQNNFSAGLIASVNHNGDSDSTGAVAGNILGAVCGYGAIEEKWKTNLELSDVILEMADDLCYGGSITEYGHYKDLEWERKYVTHDNMRNKKIEFFLKVVKAGFLWTKRAVRRIKPSQHQSGSEVKGIKR